jgi:hypothetical protein
VPINAIAVPIVQSKKDDIVDSRGQIYVRRDQVDEVRANPDARRPLVLRTNAREDCLDVLYRSELEDSADDPFNKSGMHIHFMQFDVQASDGVDLGYNFEQTVRPFRLASHALGRRVAPGDTRLPVTDPGAFRPGALIGVGMGEDQTFETAVVVGVEGGSLVVADPLTQAHDAGALVSTEFVRYQWFPDAQFGTAFFHDHVNVPFSGRHGLYGAVVAEPPGATWHDPHTGADVSSGLVADVHADPAQPLAAGYQGSFRELVVGLQDDNTLSHVGRSSGSAVSMRVESLDQRRATASDPSELFSSRQYGDPETPMLNAYVGDPVAMRTFVGANNEVHSLHVDGHVFRSMPFDPNSPLTNNVHLGISERADLWFTAGGIQRLPGDYLWYNGRTIKLREGSWGLLRVLGDVSDQLKILPGHDPPAPAPVGASVCSAGAPRRQFDVAAIDVALPMLGGKPGKVFVVESQRAAVESGTRPASPLVLRADVGDCVVVDLHNRTTGGPVTFHTDRLLSDPQRSAGVTAGNDEPQGVPPGESRTYELYAAPELGEGTAMVRDFGDVLVNPALGLYGAIIVGPKGARYVDPTTGNDVDGRVGWRVDVIPADGRPAYRDVALFFQDDDEGIGTHKMPYTTSVDGAAAINYRVAPLGPRLTKDRDPSSVLSAASPAGLPATPVVEVRVGDPVRLHVLAPSSEQAQVFSLDGHEWTTTSRVDGPRQSSQALAALDVLDLNLFGGAGSPARLPGDYVFGNHREAYREAGQWGILRVLPCGARTGSATDLPGSPCAAHPGGSSGGGAVVAVAGVVVAAVVGAVVLVRRRRRVVAPGSALSR